MQAISDYGITENNYRNSLSIGLIFSVVAIGSTVHAQQGNTTSTTGQITKGEIVKGEVKGGNITKGTVQNETVTGADIKGSETLRELR